MRKVNVTLTAQTILQLDAGTHEAVRDGGNLYVLLQQEDGFEEKKETASAPEGKVKPTTGSVKPTQAKEAIPEPKKAVNDAVSKGWTEEDMMEMDTNDLLDECDNLGINPEDTKGRNTNKKLRTLILDYWANSDGVANNVEKGKEDASGDTPEDSKLVEIPESKWEELNENDLVLAKLDMEGDDGEKLWEAEVVGWKKPKGGTEEKLYVFFTEDDQEDYLRKGDKLFEYSENI